MNERVIKPATARDEFRVVIDTDSAGRAVNRQILGSNVQWVDHGDDLVDAQGRLRPVMFERVQAVHPSILRYPGGSQADTYHWERGIGPVARRGDNEHFNSGRMQSTIMGTQEFLELCEALDAQALITVNMASGDAAEAARWVSFVNRAGVVSRRTGRRLPAVKYWELGNEPYLKDDAQKQLSMSPEEFGRRAQAFSVAMRAVDPGIRLGLPLTNDRRNGFPATPYPGFTREVLRQLHAPVDYVSLHDAYLPFAMDREYSRDTLYWAAMAASRSVTDDFDQMHALLQELRPAQVLPFAITEYNAIFTLGRGASDEYVASPVAALYVADLLRTLAQRPDIELANFWSLSGNWFFGAIRSNGDPRPSYAAFELFDELLQGMIIPAELTTQTVDTPSVGGVSPTQGLRLVETLVTRQNRTLRVLIIHKDDSREGHGILHLRGAVAGAIHLTELDWDDLWQVDRTATATQRHEKSWTGGGDISIDVAPHSIALLTVQLAVKSP